MTIYQQILKATDDLDGWASQGKRLTLANLVLALRPSVIVETGVWGGKSLIPMALAALQVPHTTSLPRIIGIDPWLASESIQGQQEKDKEWWDNQAQHDLVYGRFMAALSRLGLQEIVEVARTSSLRYKTPEKINLLHLDSNHGPYVMDEIRKYAPAVVSGGVVVMDDLDWNGGHVAKAAEWLKENGFLELHPLGTGAVYLNP